MNEQEKQVIQLMAEGLTSREIEQLLKYRPGSVETMRIRMFHKVNVKNSCHLIAWAARNGVIDVTRPEPLFI